MPASLPVAGGLIRARTKAALGAKRARGERVSLHASYGTRFEGDKIVPCAGEQGTIARARDLGASGLSLRAVAAHLAVEGHTSRTGKPFAAIQVARMLDGAVAAG